MKRDLEIINKKLLGEFISRFSVGDTWSMHIGDCYLSAQAIEFEEETRITEFLQENYKNFHYSIDKEDISKSAIMAANLRKKIIQVSLDQFKNLTIEFENGSTMRILTDTDVVDWQWCINKSDQAPYVDYEIACFYSGETQLN